MRRSFLCLGRCVKFLIIVGLTFTCVHSIQTETEQQLAQARAEMTQLRVCGPAELQQALCILDQVCGKLI